MIERIDNKGIDTSLLTQHNKDLEAVRERNESAAEPVKSAVLAFLNDRAEVSNDAKRLLEAERFGRLASQIEEPFDSDKVARLREMVQHGRMSDILSSFDDNALAESLLASPTAAFLR